MKNIVKEIINFLSKNYTLIVTGAFASAPLALLVQEIFNLNTETAFYPACAVLSVALIISLVLFIFDKDESGRVNKEAMNR